MPRAQTPAQTFIPTLEASLYASIVDVLKWYASAIADNLPTRKTDLVALLTRALTDQAALKRLLSQLTPVQQQVVAEVVYNLGGRYDAERIAAKFPTSQAPKLLRNSSYGFYSARAQKDTATPYDLFFFYSYELGRYIPSDLATALRSLVPPPPATQLESQAQPPSIPKLSKYHGHLPELTTSQNERAILHDLSATLYLIQQGKVAISPATRLPTLPALRQLRQNLLAGDYFAGEEYERAEDAIRPLALVVLVQAARWAAPTTSGNKLELTKAGQALLGAPLGPRHIRDIWERWLKSDLLDELSRIRNIKGQQAKSTRLTKPADRRATLPAMLRIFPPGRWVTSDELLRYLRAVGQLPAIERGNPSLSIGSYSTYDDPAESYGSGKYWDVIVGSYLRATLWEYVATLGLIEIAYTRPEDSPHSFGDLYYLDSDYLSRYDGLLAMRLTNLGAYVLGLADDYAPPEPIAAEAAPVLKILPNLDIVITDAALFMPSDRALLERIAAPQSQDVYRLTRESLLEAADSGLDLQQIKQFLATKSGQPAEAFPQIVRVFFEDLDKRVNALRETGALLAFEAGDEYLLIELASNPALRAFVQLGTLGERSVLFVPEQHSAAARRQLKKLGYLPRKAQPPD